MILFWRHPHVRKPPNGCCRTNIRLLGYSNRSGLALPRLGRQVYLCTGAKLKLKLLHVWTCMESRKPHLSYYYYYYYYYYTTTITTILLLY